MGSSDVGVVSRFTNWWMGFWDSFWTKHMIPKKSTAMESGQFATIFRSQSHIDEQ